MAHGGTPDEQVALITVVGGLWIGWAGLSRLRNKGFPRMPIGGAWTLAIAGGIVIVAGLTLPRQFMRPNAASPTAIPSGARPASTATLAITRPTEGQIVSGSQVEVVMTLEGGTIIAAASTKLTPDTGHLHLSIDGKLVSMTYGLVQLLPLQGLSPGKHTIEAEFVAADHGPFDPRVVAQVTFTIASGT